VRYGTLPGFLCIGSQTGGGALSRLPPATFPARPRRAHPFGVMKGSPCGLPFITRTLLHCDGVNAWTEGGIAGDVADRAALFADGFIDGRVGFQFDGRRAAAEKIIVSQ